MKKVIIICLSVLVLAAVVVGAVFGIKYYQKNKYLTELHDELESLFNQEIVLTFVGSEEYALTMKNTTQTVFKNIYFTASFYDEDYSQVDEYFIDSSVWSPGKEADVSLWTGKEFSTVELQLEYIENKYNTTITSDYHEISYLAESPLHQQLREELEEVFDQEIVLNGLGGEDYVLTVSNTTETNYRNIACEYQFYGEKDDLLEERYDLIDIWNAGAELEREISTDKSFTKAMIRFSYEGAENDQEIATEYHEIKVVNEAAVEIKIKNVLPMKVDETFGDEVVHQTYTIQSFQFEEETWFWGECSCAIKISGTKIFDIEGNNNADYVTIDWRLLDSSNTVVESGFFQTEDIKVNEAFVIEDSTEGLKPGTYYLELYVD